VRHGFDKKQTFAVMVGTSLRSCEAGAEDTAPSLTRFGVVQTLDTKAKRRLYAVLRSQDCQMHQAIPFLSDGENTLQHLQVERSPKATHLLDWQHVMMTRTV
jgi:hypothetical protein